MMRWAGHGLVVLLLTGLTQLGGIPYALALFLRNGWLARLSAFGLGYLLVFGVAQLAAPIFGREALPCRGDVLRMQSAFYCVTMRNFVTPELAAVARGAANDVATRFPGTVTLALDGNFPFLTGFPLPPHLSHADGEKLDFAFYYQDAKGYTPGQTASPLGYFAFEHAGAEQCPPAFPTLRWDMGWFRPFLHDLDLEPQRTSALIRALAADERVTKIFVEPPIAAALGLSGDKLRFQGCRAARHDDHIHMQL